MGAGTCKACGGPYPESYPGSRSEHICDRCEGLPPRLLPKATTTTSTCKKRTRKSIMEFTVCSRAAVRDGFCTRHHPSYVSPADQRALTDYDHETSRLRAEGILPYRSSRGERPAQ